MNSKGSSGDGLGSAWLFWRRRRFLVAIIAFFGYFSMQSQRVNLPITIMSMNAKTQHILENGTTIFFEQEFDWDNEMTGFFLSSFFYGYIATQILGGCLAARVGGSLIFGIGGIGATILTLLTPPLLRMNGYILFALRIGEGFLQGLSFPCINNVWSHWAPEQERTTLSGLAFAGNFMGIALTFPITGVLVARLGWPSVFYILGSNGVVWFVLWCLIVKSRPEDDPYISAQELRYIQMTRKRSSDGVIKSKHPWMKFLTSMPVWATIVARTCDDWGFYTLQIELPAIMRDSFGYSLQKLGTVSLYPFLAMSILMICAGLFADWLRTDGKFTTTQVRKLYCCGIYAIQTILFIIIANIQTSVIILTCICVIIALDGISLSVFSVNHLDIAPQHASILIGLSNTIGTLPGIIIPSITGFIVEHNEKSEWQKVFYIAAAMYFFACIFFGVFGSGELQKWATTENEDTGIQNSSSWTTEWISTISQIISPVQAMSAPRSSMDSARTA